MSQETEEKANLRAYLALLTGVSTYSNSVDDKHQCFTMTIDSKADLIKAQEIIAQLLLLGVELDIELNKYQYNSKENPREYIGCAHNTYDSAIPIEHSDVVGLILYQMYGADDE